MVAKSVELEIGSNTQKAQKEIVDLKNSSKKEFTAMSKIAEKHAKDVTGAYRAMGIKTDKVIENSTRTAKENYTKIKNSGTASAREIRKAHDAMTAKIKANNRELAGGAGKLSKAFALIKGPLLAFVGIAAATTLLKKMTSSALENEIQVRKLKTQVELLGISYEENEASIDKAIQATSKYAAVQSGDVSEVMQQLLFVTGDLKKSQENLNLVYDLAHLKGLSLSESTAMVGRALSGNVETLGRYFIEFKGLNETLGKNATLLDKAAFAQAFLNEKVSGSIKNMTEHERSVTVVKNSWATFVQFAGEQIFFVLDKIIWLGREVFLGMLGMAKGINAVGQRMAWLTDKLGLTTGAQTALIKRSRELSDQWDNLEDRQRGVNKETDKANRKNRSLAKTSKEVADEIRKKSDAIDESKKALKEENEAALANANEKIASLKEINELRKENIIAIKLQITETEKELAGLIKGADDAVTLVERLKGIKAASQKRVEQQGMTPADKAIDDMDRARERLETELAGASAKVRAEILTQVAMATAAVIELPEESKTTQDLEDAKIAAEELETKANDIAAAFAKVAQEALPPVQEKLDAQKKTLKESEIIMKGSLVEIDKLSQAAQAFKDKLKEPTASTHTTKFVTQSADGQGNDGEGPIPIGARTGTHIPGYGGGDTVPANLEKGEYVHRKEAVRRLGLPAMNAINRGDISGLLSILTSNNLQRMDSGKLMATATAPTRKYLAAQGMQEGGPVSTGSRDTIDLNLTVPDVGSLKAIVPKKESEEFFKNMKRANIIYGRYRRKY